MSEVITHRPHHYDFDEDEGSADGRDEDFEPEPLLETGYANVIIVDNLPVVGEDKYPKLVSVIKKIYSQIGEIREPDGLNVPLDAATKQTKGFAFIEFTSREAADSAVAQTNGYKLDKAHIFKVNHFDEFDKFMSVTDDYKDPDVKPFEPTENLESWLLDARYIRGMEQFVVRQGDLTEVWWHDNKHAKPVLEEARPRWTETYVMWSPQGTYLATFHKQGVQLWGGPKWARLTRLQHPGVKLVDFSPCERYLVTVSPQFQEDDDPKDPKCIIVWDARTGRKMRGYQGSQNPIWPVFQWSHDDKYLARMGDDAISIYETPSMNLIDKQSLRVAGLKEFSWSPKEPLVAYYVPEQGNTPAKVAVIEIPSRREVRSKSFFNVIDCKMHWHADGQYLAVKLDRYTKNKKNVYVNFELFRMREKDIPTELLEIKTPIMAFAWEPKGDRFAIIHGEGAGAKYDVSFYSMADKKLTHLKTLEKKPANHLFWSPRGSFIVLAGLKNLNGVLEFFNVNSMETMATDEHPNCTAVDWDPSGRFLATTVSHWRFTTDTGYHIFTFYGRAVVKVMKDRFYQVLWRPRPPTLLSKEELETLKKNMGSYSERFAAEDTQEQAQVDRANQEFRSQMRAEFERLLAEREAEYQAQADVRARLRGTETGSDDYVEVEETFEEVLDTTTEVVEG